MNFIVVLATLGAVHVQGINRIKLGQNVGR